MRNETLKTLSFPDLPVETGVILHPNPELKQGRNNLLCIVGVTSVGKSFLAQRLVENAASDIPVINVGTMLAQHLNLGRDQIRTTIDTSDLYQGLKVIASAIVDTGQLAVVTDHVIPKQRRKTPLPYDPYRKFDRLNYYAPTDPSQRILRPEHYVVVLSDPKQAIEWRELENSQSVRQRDVEDPDQVAVHEHATFWRTWFLAQNIGSGLSVICNRPDVAKTEDNVVFLAQRFAEIAA